MAVLRGGGVRRRFAWILFLGLLASSCGGDDSQQPAADAGVDGTSGLRPDGGAAEGGVDAGRALDAGSDAASQDGSAGDGSIADGGIADGGGGRDGALGQPDASGFHAGAPEPEADAGGSVLRHHKNRNRDGIYVEPAFTRAAVTGAADAGLPGLHKDTTFSAVLPDPNDNVYAQPLFVDGMGGQDLVIVATEADNVYALDAATGANVWTTHLGTPVPISVLGCGNIDPVGITGTPVIDFASRTVFFDAEVATPVDAGDAGEDTSHQIFALSIDTGAIKAGWPIDVAAVVPGFAPHFQGERGALAVLDGTLYIPYGGRFGDCPPYHGWVVAVPIANPTQVQAWSTPAAAGGAWSPGGVSSDGTTLYISTGNTQGTDGGSWGGGDGVIRFGAGAAFGAPVDYFAPANWPALDGFDQDIGSAPVVFDLAGSTPGHLAIVFGKDTNAYLLDRTALGGVGGALGADAAAGRYSTLPSVATAEIITAPVVYSTAAATYVAFKGNGAACTSGVGDLTALKLVPGSPPGLAYSWCAAGGTGSPIVTTTDGQSNAIVWQLGGEEDTHVHAFDGDTGAIIAFPGSSAIIPNMRRYNPPIVAKGRLYVAADKAVFAFTL